MKLMKKVRLSTSLFSAALLIGVTSFAGANTIYNPNFDALVLEDGNSSAIVHNWEITSGIAGIHNPSNQMFSGENGAGNHDNTLYMIDDSTVSQTLTFKALEFSTYELSFDVGQRIDMPAQDYSIKVKAGSKTLLWATNPDLPATPGSFQDVDVQFSTESLPDGYITIEIETQGTGHLHFDNFEMAVQQGTQIVTEYYSSVAHFTSVVSRSTGTTCEVIYSMNQNNGNSYVDNFCECVNSTKAFVGASDSLDGDRYNRHYECVVKTRQ